MKMHIVGLGNLGLFLVRHFVESGFKVSGCDINVDKEGALLSLGSSSGRGFQADVVLLALFPKQIKGEIKEKIKKDFNPNALFVNVSSLQHLGLKALCDAGVGKMRTLSFHPLFGPVGVIKSGWAGKQIIVTAQPKKDGRASTVLETFIRRGVIIDRMSPEEHDRKMLPHALAFLIAELVKTGAERIDPRFLTGSGRQMLGLLDFTEAGSLELRDLILSNSGLKEVVPKLKRVLQELSEQHGW